MKKKSILYVDDEPMNLLLFSENFENRFIVYTAESGIEGLKELEEHISIEVVVSDMHMPVINGIEFIKRAKNNFPHIIFFILTGYNITPEIDAALESGLIAEYFNKPFNIEAIEKSINNALGNLDITP